MTKEIDEIIEQIELKRFSAVVLDAGANIQNVYKIITEKYDNIFNICKIITEKYNNILNVHYITHAVNLISKNIFILNIFFLF